MSIVSKPINSGAKNIKTYVVHQSTPVVPLGPNAPSSGGVQTPVLFKRHTFNTASLVWTINHNQNTDMFIPTLKLNNGTEFYALITVVDKNTFQVHLTDAYAGYVDVLYYRGA